MTCYIANKKANNFSKTSGFAVTITDAACDSFYIYILSVFAFFVPRPLLRLLCLVRFCVFCASSTPSVSVVPRWVVCSSVSSMARFVYVCYALVSCLLIYVFRNLLRLHLLCLGELFAYLRLLWLALSASAIHSVCVCYALMSRLLRLRLLGLVLSTSAVCSSFVLFSTLFAPFAFAMLRRVVYSVCVFRSLLCLRLQFYHFHCKLHRITVTYYIVNIKTDNFKTSWVVFLVVLALLFIYFFIFTL